MSLVATGFFASTILLLALLVVFFVYKKHEQIPISLNTAIKLLLKKRSYSQYTGLAEKLGYSENDKLLIIHADDLGLARSVNKASFDAIKKNMVSSASIMAPCAYTDEVAVFAKKNPNADLGVHLTVTNEWKGCMWGPVLSKGPCSSLVDYKGGFHFGVKNFVNRSDPAEVKEELQAQIDSIRSLGINPTHIDSHEGALFFSKDLFRAYVEIGVKNELPVFVPKLVAIHFDQKFPKPESLIIIENFFMAQKGLKENQWERFYLNTINNLKPGLSQLLVHLAHDDKEMQKICGAKSSYGAKWRELDNKIITGPGFKNALVENNIKLVTWGEIKKVLFGN